MGFLKALARTGFAVFVGLISTLVAASAALTVATRSPLSPAVERIIHRWARAWLWAAGVDLEVSGDQHVDPSRSYVVVANHLSNLDIMVCFLAIPVPIRYLAKKELFRVPLLAPAMRAVGIIEVDRQAGGAALESINQQTKTVIARGHSLIIFPEGTRSRTGELRAFKKGAFTIASKTGLAILPVAIHGTYEAWQPGTLLIRGGRVRVVIDPPLPVEGASPEELRSRAGAVISGRLGELRSDNVQS